MLSKSRLHSRLEIRTEVILHYWLSGNRYKGGMSAQQALMWNTGTCAVMVSEKAQATEKRG